MVGTSTARAVSFPGSKAHMLNGKRIEVRYYGSSRRLVKLLTDALDAFPGLAVCFEDCNHPFFEIWEGQKKVSTYSDHISETSLYWKLKEAVYGKSEFKKGAGSKHRDEELENASSVRGVRKKRGKSSDNKRPE